MVNEASAEESQRGGQRTETRSRAQRESDRARSESEEKMIHEVSVVSIQRQSAATCEKVSYRRRAEPEAHTGAPMKMDTDESAALPSALAANPRRRMVERSAQGAVTTQEGVDGDVERQWRSQVLSKYKWKHHGVVNHGSCAQMGKTIESLGFFSLRKTDG